MIRVRLGRPPSSRPQSRFTGAVDGSSFTRVGPIHVTPPSVERNRNTSTFELAGVPLRLSSTSAYRSSTNAPPRLSATTFEYELTRKQLFVSVFRVCAPRGAQSGRVEFA